MKRPKEPKPEDCCNSGCNPCIFDVYEKQLQLYESYNETGETSSFVENALSPLEYTEFYVVNNIDLENEHHLILFKFNSTSDEKQVIWSPGDHILFKYSHKDVKCSRAYTPLKINRKGTDKYDFAIIVKIYPNGVVSNHLCSLNLGDVTLWRGPYGHYKLEHNKFSRIIMIAQGTGITPLYSIIKQVLNNEEDMTKILLIYCCKNLKTVLLREELYSFKSYWNFKYEVYLSINNNEPCKYQEPIFPHKFECNNMNKLKPFSEFDQFILCGSDKFMEHFKNSLAAGNVKDELIVTL